MLKTAFLIRSLECGGAERQLVTLVKALDKKYFDITVLCFYSGGPFEQDLRSAGVTVISLEKQGRWDLVGFFLRLVSTLKNLRPQVLHTYLGDANLLSVFVKPLLPSTKVVWGVRASNIDFSNYDWLASLIFQWQCFFSRFADIIIANSQAGKAFHVAHGFPAKKIVVIPNGINTEFFKPDLEARAKVRLEWQVPTGVIVVGLVGRLDPMKDHPTFLKAAALLSQEQHDVHFVCVGHGSESYTQQMRELTEELNIASKVTWIGMCTDMPAAYSALDIACSSSYGEGFSNVIGEAMACGVPCVVTDVGDSAWIVDTTGIVVPPKDPAALKVAIQQLIQTIKTSHSLTPRQRIINYFSLTQLVTQTTTVLLNICHDQKLESNLKYKGDI